MEHIKRAFFIPHYIDLLVYFFSLELVYQAILMRQYTFFSLLQSVGNPSCVNKFSIFACNRDIFYS